MPPRNILVIDDDRSTRRLLSAALQRNGFQVIDCPDGREALQLIEMEPPALIVSDYEMPEFNGAQLCELVRQNASPSIAELPIILLTAHSGEEHEVECLRAGANDFVSKPVNTVILAARIRTQLRLDAMRSELQQQKQELTEWRQNHERDLDAARSTQKAILPSRLPAISGWEAAGFFQPVIQVGGDMYDWVRLPDGGWLIWIADATGHGASAALLTTLTKLVFRHAAGETGSSPRALLKEANKEFYSILRGKSFMTACCLVLRPDSDHVCLAGAGHPPTIIRRANGAVEFISSQSPPMGILSDLVCEEQSVEVRPGDTVLLYTDGLYSGLGDGGLHLAPCDIPPMLPATSNSASQFLDAAVRKLRTITSEPLPDDLAAVALRRIDA